MANLFKVTYEIAPAGVNAVDVPQASWMLTELPSCPEPEAISQFNRLRAIARTGGGVRAVKILESNLPLPIWTDVTAAHIPA